ncbi:MAG: protein kinase [Planctomycetes bacterium]|nr:protein kinase [Planctomycetota bacterium]
MPKLVVEKGGDKGKSIQVGTQGSVVVGRDTSAGITINDTMASRNHFKVECRAGAYFLVDLNSKNGTLLNGSRVKESRIAPGDRVQVGETVFSFMEDVKPKEDLVGRIVGRRYKIIERIGRGGMGTVYKAEQIRLNRNVALKMLQQELVGDPTFIKKFLDEARAAAQFNHPNVVTIYEIDVDNDIVPPVPFIAMEYLPGGSVQDMLSREKKLPPDRALAVVLDAARGLEYAEKKQIVHRDIKPDNLMISEEGRIKIGDLGLAKSLKQDGSRPESPEGVFGTPHYISPEQALNKPVDIRADIYSLGATFYRVLAGTTPYQGSSAKEIVVNKLREEPPSLELIDPSLPKILTSIVERMMKREPADRYATAKDLVADLDRARREIMGSLTGPLNIPGDGSSASASNTATAMGSEGRRSATPIVVLTGAAAMLIVTVAVVAATMMRHPNDPQPPPGPQPGPVEGTGDPEKLEALSQKALSFAEMVEKTTNMGDPEAIRALMDAYSAIVKDYPGTGAEKKARTQLEFFQKQIDTLAADAMFAGAERRELALAAVRKSFALDKVKFEDVVREAEAAMAAYGEFVEKCSADPRVADAKKKSGVIDGELSVFRSRYLAWQAEARAILEVLDRKAFGEAETRLGAADKSPEFKEYAAAIKAIRDRVRLEAESSLETLAAQVDQKRKDFDFEGARALLESARAWGFSAFKKRLDDLAEAIDRAEIEHKGATARKVRDEQVAVLREARVRAIDSARNRFGFAGATAIYEAALLKLKDDDLVAEAAGSLSDCKAAGALQASFMGRIADHKLRAKASASFDKIHMDGELVRASGESIWIKVQGGAEVSVNWKDLRTTEYRQLMRTWEHDFNDARGLVATDLALGLTSQVETDMAAAEKEVGPANKEEIEGLRKRVEGAKNWPEREAADRLDQAKEEIRREKWQRALDDLNELSTRLNATKYYADHRATIDSLQDDCKGKLKK